MSVFKAFNVSVVTRKQIFVSTLVALLVLFITGCGPNLNDPTGDPADSDRVIALINDASVINVQKELLTVADKWEVYADGEHVANITGQTIRMTETYNMATLSGNLIGSEAESYSSPARPKAKAYDQNNVQTATFKGSRSVFIKIAATDMDDVELATAQNNINPTKMKIIDPNGDTIYEVDKSILAFPNRADSVIIKVADNDLTNMNAIWLTVIMNEIDANRYSKANRSSYTA